LIVKEFEKKGINKLNPAQEKAVKSGILEGENILVCSPTGSGKTMIASFALAKMLGNGKAVYVVPLKALASEKFKDYTKFLEGSRYTVAYSTGDMDSDSEYLRKYDLIILTVEKFDSLIRHRSKWINDVSLVIVDEIHLLNDPGRGPTLEIVITLLKKLLKNVQIVALSATIGNPEELAEWLDAKLVYDEWRPVKLEKGVYYEGEVEFQ